MKSAKNIKRMAIKKQAGKNNEHPSSPGMSFGDSNPDQATKIRVKVAKGLMIKH